MIALGVCFPNVCHRSVAAKLGKNALMHRFVVEVFLECASGPRGNQRRT